MTTSTTLESPQELQRRLAAERRGAPFLLFRGADGGQQLFELDPERSPVTLGRGTGCDILFELDPEASRLHAELQRLGDHWVIADDGLSRNGTFVNGERIVGRHRLGNGDVVRCGNTLLRFRDPSTPGYQSTRPANGGGGATVTDSQRRVLVALCRPLRDGGSYAMPASNQEIADELFLSVGAVKAHLRTLFEKLRVEDLAHNRKRLRLAERALETGLVSLRELDRPRPEAPTR
jgi:pSer/pThr/pTyr-binding forkhead associated (FHA) protein